MAPRRRQRLRYDSLDHQVYPDGSCRVDVRLEWQGVIYSAEARGMEPLDGALRTVAQATLEAAETASDGRLNLSLLGVKTLRAFDSLLVVASVRADDGESTYKLLGAKAAMGEDIVETAARAILDALNRVLEPYVVEGES